MASVVSFSSDNLKCKYMKANELRIGNYITFDTVDKPSYFEINLFNYLDRLKPIPLTEEWLLKAGFMYKNYHPTTIGSTNIFGSGLYISQMINNGFSLVFQTDKKSFYFEFSDRYIKYVHELQNIYFALTGVELVFSTEP